MRYYNTGKTQRYEKPKRKSWQFLHRATTRNRRYKQSSESAALSLHNPYAVRKPANRLKIKGSILPIIIIAWFGLLLHLPYFQITKINYSDLKIIKQSEVAEVIDGQLAQGTALWPAKNFFILNGSSLAELLKNKFSFNSVTVTKVFPQTLNIQFQEKTTAGIYDNGREYYLLDGEGKVIKHLRSVRSAEYIFQTSSASMSTSLTTITTSPASFHTPDWEGIKEEFGEFPIIYDRGELNSNTTIEQPLKSDIMRGTMEIYNSFRKMGNIKPRYFILDGAETGITAMIDKPFKIKFKPTSDVNEQIKRLQIFLKSNRPNEYIDLRYGDRIFWK